MRVLVFTSLYPTPTTPHLAGFMPGRLDALSRHAEVEAVVPYRTLPITALLRFRLPTPADEGTRFNLYRCPFGAWPGVNRQKRPAQMARGCRRLVEQLHAERPFDVVLGHFVYPDGVAAVRLATALGIPAVVTAQGSDVNLAAKVPSRRRQIAVALQQAQGVIVVSEALRQRLTEFGIPAGELPVLPSGYDPEEFRPRDRAAARRELGLSDDTWLVYVGQFRRLKRVDTILSAVAKLPEVRIALVGDGPERERLANQVRRLNLGQRVRMVGPQAHDRVALWLAAAEALVMASETEGTPTAMIEALAMGIPVVGTHVGGIPDLVGDTARLVAPDDPAALANAIAETLADPPAIDRLTARVAHLSWPAIGQAEAEILAGVVRGA